MEELKEDMERGMVFRSDGGRPLSMTVSKGRKIEEDD